MWSSEWMSVCMQVSAQSRIKQDPGLTYHDDRANGMLQKQNKIASKHMHTDRQQVRKNQQEKEKNRAPLNPRVRPGGEGRAVVLL